MLWCRMLVLLVSVLFHQPYSHGFYSKIFLCLFHCFVHNEIMCNVIGKHNFIMYKNNGRSIHLVVSIHTSHIYTATQSCKHTHRSVAKINNPLLRLLVPEKVVQHSLLNPPSVNYATRRSNTHFSAPRGRMNTPGSVGRRRRTVEKARLFRTQSAGNRGQSDFIRGARLSW